MPEPMVTWDRPMLERFKRALSGAKARGLAATDVFTFDGHEFVLGYAKYLVEYLEQRLAK